MRSALHHLATSVALMSAILCAFWTNLVHAQEVTTVVVTPFDVEGTQARDLSASIELELEFEEHLLLSPWRPFVDEVGTANVGAVSAQTLGAAMERLNIKALIRAGRTEQDAGVLLLFVHRAPEGEAVYMHPVRIADAIKDPRELAVNPLSAALRDLELLQPLSERAMESILYDFLGKKPPPQAEPEGRVPLGSEPEPAPPEPEATPPKVRIKPDRNPKNSSKSGEKKLFGDAEPIDTAPDEDPTGFAKLIRVAAYYAPNFLYYRACQPGTVDLLGNCSPAASSPLSTELPLPMLASAAVFGETFAIPYVGLAGAATVSFTEITTNNNSIAPFTTLQLAGDVAAIPHYDLHLSDVDLRIGARLGYGFSLGITQDHRNEFGVTLLPSHDTHEVLLGVRAGVALANVLEASLDLDAIPVALHSERPDTVGNSELGYGAHGRLNVDVLVFAGLRVGLFVEGTALRSPTSGQGTRLTRQLQRFNAGDVVLFTARAGIGVGFGR